MVAGRGGRTLRSEPGAGIEVNMDLNPETIIYVQAFIAGRKYKRVWLQSEYMAKVLEAMTRHSLGVFIRPAVAGGISRTKVKIFRQTGGRIKETATWEAFGDTPWEALVYALEGMGKGLPKDTTDIWKVRPKAE